MIISNKVKDYSDKELNEFTKLIHEINDMVQETNEIVSSNLIKKPESTPDNVYFINTQIKTEFLKLQTVSLPFHEVIKIYHRWHKELLDLATNNANKLYKPKIQFHVENVMNICKTFTILMKNIK